MEYCYICGKLYSSDEIEPIYYRQNGDIIKFRTISYKGQNIPLCNKCFRTIALEHAINLYLDIII